MPANRRKHASPWKTADNEELRAGRLYWVVYRNANGPNAIAYRVMEVDAHRAIFERVGEVEPVKLGRRYCETFCFRRLDRAIASIRDRIDRDIASVGVPEEAAA